LSCDLRGPSRGLCCAALLLALALALARTADAAEEKTWYAETLTSSPRGINVTDYWAKGRDRMRAETVIAGHRFITIVNGKRYYSIDATEGKVIDIERAPRALADDKQHPRMIGLEGIVIRDRGGEKVKSEKLAGRMCDVYSNTDALGRQQVWVQQESSSDQLPLRVEVYNRQAAATIRTDYLQWATGLELADRLFEPDPRLPVETLGYDEYVARSTSDQPPAVPVLHANLLHGGK
jgi:outer membrane lipoprotein-sorting protein